MPRGSFNAAEGRGLGCVPCSALAGWTAPNVGRRSSRRWTPATIWWRSLSSGAPGFVTGLPDDEVAQFRVDWRQRRKPMETAQLNQWKRAAENLERGGTLLIQYTAGLTSSHIVAEAEKSEKRAAAAVSSAASAAVH